MYLSLFNVSIIYVQLSSYHANIKTTHIQQARILETHRLDSTETSTTVTNWVN